MLPFGMPRPMLLRKGLPAMSALRRRELERQWLAAAALCFATWISSGQSHAAAASASAPAGVMRAVVIGVDTYQTQSALQGAVADARDLSEVFRRIGAKEVEMLTGSDATRSALTAALDGILSRTRPDDLVAITFSGLGASLTDENNPGPALLLSKFDPADPTLRAERLSHLDLSDILGRIAARGARSLLIVDACFGSSGTRLSDRRNPQPTFKCVDAPVNAAAQQTGRGAEGRFLPSAPARSLVLTAAENSARVPEITVPGRSGHRGALSFAVARGLEGRADLDRDGTISLSELSTYVGQVAYQLADNRQRADGITGDATIPGPSRTRGFIVVPKQKGQVQSEGGPQDVWSESETVPTQSSGPGEPPRIADGLKVVEVAVVGGRPPSVPPSAGRTPIRFLEPGAAADVVWDLSSGEVVARGDTIAVAVGENDIQDVVDRLTAVEGLKVLGSSYPENVRVVPNDGRHSANAGVTIRIGTSGSFHVLVFNLAGDGTIQLLYPLKDDPRSVKTPFTLPPTVVQPPFGADCVVAITSRTPLKSLERAVQQLQGKKAALDALKYLQDMAPRGARIGFATLFTGS
jgi:Caspase domain